MLRTLLGVSSSPSSTSSTTKSERRKTVLARCFSVSSYDTSPSASSTVRTALTIASNSAGSSEKALSGPGSSRDRVKCFSMTHAPSATAAMGTPMPIV